MIVMITAMTPSLNASRRWASIWTRFWSMWSASRCGWFLDLGLTGVEGVVIGRLRDRLGAVEFSARH